MEDNNKLNKHQRVRYSRSLMLPEFSDEHQLALIGSKVLIVGAGALGSVCSMYLAASGVGHITIVDFDTVDLSNLQRQLSFVSSDVGKKKVTATAERLLSINSDVEVTAIDRLLRKSDAETLIPEFDLVIEGSDNPTTKYMISDLCRESGITCVIGGISETRGQVMSYTKGNACYRDWFPEPGCGEGFTPCSVGGILGPVPGIIGSIMSAEALKLLTGIGKPLVNRLLSFDALNMNTLVFDF